MDLLETIALIFSIGILVYLLIVYCLYQKQFRIIYQNRCVYVIDLATISKICEKFNTKVKELTVRTQDGVKLAGWLFFSNSEENKRTMIYFHENSLEIYSALPYIMKLIEKTNSNVVLFGYRGYGLSEGTPEEKGLINDGEAIIDFVLNGDLNIDKSNVFILGKSLGVSVAVHSILKYQYLLKGLILENGFTSLLDLTRDKFPWLLCFARLLQRQYWENKEVIKALNIPILFLVSADDEVIPPYHTEVLYELADWSKYKNRHIFNFASHNNIWILAPLKYFSVINAFVEDIEKKVYYENQDYLLVSSDIQENTLDLEDENLA